MTSGALYDPYISLLQILNVLSQMIVFGQEYNSDSFYHKVWMMMIAAGLMWARAVEKREQLKVALKS